MDTEVVIASLACIGELNQENRYINPLIDISLDPSGIATSKTEDELEYIIDVLRGDVVIKVSTSYIEATEYLDEPSFKMTVRDEIGQVIDVVSDEYDPAIIRDKFLYHDKDKSELYYISKIDDFVPGEPLTYQFDLEAELALYEWTDEGSRGGHVDTITKMQSVIVKVTANAIERVLVTPSFDPTSNVKWKNYYRLIVKVENLHSQPIQYKLPCFEDDDREIWDYSINLLGAKLTQTHTEDIRQDWTWYKEHPPIAFITSGPTSKTFKYTIQLILCEYVNGQLVETVFGPYEITKTVDVQQNKLDSAYWANVCWGFAAACFANSGGTLFWGVVCTVISQFLLEMTLPFCLFLFQLCGLYFSAGCLLEMIGGWHANDAKEKCPVPFDQEYKQIAEPDMEKYLPKETREMSSELEQLQEAFAEMVALNENINSTYAKYMSAQREYEAKAAEKQKVHAKESLSELRKRFTSVKKLMPAIQKDTEDTISKIDPTKLAKLADYYWDKGIPPDQRKKFNLELRRRGMDPKDLPKLKKELKDKGPSEFLETDIRGNFDAIERGAFRIQEDAVTRVNHIDEVDDLSKEDMSLELLQEGLITLDNYFERRKRKELASNYLILEIENIRHHDRKRLGEAGIHSTLDILRACRRRNGTKILSARTGIDRKRIVNWCHIVKLMQVRGIGEREANHLIWSGVKTRKTLSKVSEKKLHEKMKKAKEVHKLKGRIPSEATIKKWVSSSRKTRKK